VERLPACRYNNIPVTLPGNITAREKETPSARCEKPAPGAAAAGWRRWLPTASSSPALWTSCSCRPTTPGGGQ
jgi:hypothetical protein